MASSAKAFSPIPRKKGFQKWVKLSLDDLPLIRPPKHHMVVQMTGGLTNLFVKIAEDKKTRGNTDPDVPEKPQGQLDLEKDHIIRVDFVTFYADKLLADEDKENKEKDGNKKVEDGSENNKDKVIEDKAQVNGDEVKGATNDSMHKSEETAPEKMDCDEAEDKEKSENKRKSDERDEEGKTAVKPVDDTVKETDKDAESNQDKKESTDEKNSNNISNDKIDDEGGGEHKGKLEKEKLDSKITEENDKDPNCSEKDEKSKLENKDDKEMEANGSSVNIKKDGDKEVPCDKEEEDAAEEDEDEEEEEEEEEEETTEYTDEDGEFVPQTGMALLAGRYKYLQVLGRGQSALIVKAEDTFCNNRPLAIKVLHRVYKPIGSQEADILLELHRADPYLHVPFARIKTQFLYGPHYCLVFEALSPTPLYTHYDQRDIRGTTSLPYIRQLAVKLLTTMGFLHKQNVIHADLKPENILLAKEEDLNSIMVVDFGNALRNTEEELSLYYSDFELQTLLYRAPEVIFGLRFSLEVDMWSLGCLLAECYIGKPLFMGKTKHDILTKISKILGPFPKEFSEGMCGEEFCQFIGRPLSRYQRIQNLGKRLNKCTDVHFLMLLEKMLTYLPERRMVPAEAACHPFVAYISPFLYLTPTPGQLRYPTVVLDITTYPFLPEAVEEEGEDQHTKACRRRLLSLAHVIKASSSTSVAELKGTTSMAAITGSSGITTVASSTSNGNITTATTADSVLSINKQNKTVSVASTSSSQTPVSRSDVKETLKSMGLRCEDFTISVYSKEQAHAILRKQGVEVTNHNPGGGSANSRQQQQLKQQQQYKQQQGQYHMNPMNQRGGVVRNSRPASAGSGSGSNTQGFRSSVSIGRPPLSRNVVNPRMGGGGGSNTSGRSLYSGGGGGNQAQDYDDDDDDCVILDPPVNHSRPMPPKQPQQPRLPQQFQLMGTTVQVNRGAKRPYAGPQNPIGAKKPSRPVMGAGQYHQGNYHPQQQQHYRQMQHQQQQRFSTNRQRQFQHQQMQMQQQYMDDYSDEDSGGETSVQDTLKRLKNYNISITCRRNEPSQRNMGSGRNMPVNRHASSGNRQTSHNMAMNYNQSGNMRSGGGNINRSSGHHMNRAHNMHMMQANMMRSDSDYDDEHPMDSEEDTEADMAKYLECEIGEDNMGMHMVEGDEELHFGDDDEDDEEMMREQMSMQGRGGMLHSRHRPGGSYGSHNSHVNSGGDKGKSSNMSVKKRLTGSAGGNSTQACGSGGNKDDNAADTSVEEVPSRDSEGEYCEERQRQLLLKKKQTKGSHQVAGDYLDEDQEDEEEEEEEEGEVEASTSSVAEIGDHENARPEAERSDSDGEGEEDESSKLVDNLLEQHLNAVCGDAGTSARTSKENDDDDLHESEAPDDATEADDDPIHENKLGNNETDNSNIKNRRNSPDECGGSASKPNSPVNEDALLGDDPKNFVSAGALSEEEVTSKVSPDKDPLLKEADDDEIDEELEKELLGADEDL